MALVQPWGGWGRLRVVRAEAHLLYLSEGEGRTFESCRVRQFFQ